MAKTPCVNKIDDKPIEDICDVDDGGLVLRMGVINAFIDENKSFSGNPAAVIRLKEWLDDLILQQIASQNNLSETAFVVELDCGLFEIRWFTPELEVDLCGHATLAAAYYLFRYCFIDFEIEFEEEYSEFANDINHPRNRYWKKYFDDEYENIESYARYYKIITFTTF